MARVCCSAPIVRFAAIALVMFTAAAACTDTSDGSGQRTTVTTTVTAPTTAAAASARTTPTTSADAVTTSSTAPQAIQPATIEAYQRLWATERAAIVDELSNDRFGLGDDGVLRGPGGFELDTTACPTDWDNSSGVDDVPGGTVDLVQTVPLSALTTIGDIGRGAQLYFERLNAEGGIGPNRLQVDFRLVDDGYVPEQTELVIGEALRGAQPLAVSTLGTLNLDAVNELVNDACVPLLMGLALGPVWADPSARPWTTGFQMAQTTEALLWMRMIEQHADEPVTVAALVMDNYFGRTYEQAFAAAAADSDRIERFEVIHHDPAASTLTSEMATIIDIEPDVYISMTAGNPCLLAIQEAQAQDLDPTTLRVTPSPCKFPAAYLEPAGRGGDGWRIVGGGTKDPTSAVWADDPWVAFVNDELEAAGFETMFGQVGEGYGLRGWALHQVLEIAANLEGGLTRTNLILAQRGLSDMTHPMLYPGVRFAMNGNQDPYFIEGSEVATYDADNQAWAVDDVLDVDGETPPCVWQANDGGCRGT